MKRTECSSSGSPLDRLKRAKYFDRVASQASDHDEATPKKPIPSSNGTDVSTPSLVRMGLISGKFGSVAKDIEEIFALRIQASGLNFKGLVNRCSGVRKSPIQWPSKSVPDNVIDLEDESVGNDTPTSKLNFITIDSDEEDRGGDPSDERPSRRPQNAVSDQNSGAISVKDEEIEDHVDSKAWVEETNSCTEVHPEVIEDKNANSIEEEHVDSKTFAEDSDSCTETRPEVNEKKNIREDMDSRARVEETKICTEIHSEVNKEKDIGGHLDSMASAEDANPCREVDSKIKKEENVCVVREHIDNTASVKERILPAEIDTEMERDKGVYVGVEDEDNHEASADDDGLEDIWNELLMGLELSKEPAVDPLSDEQASEDEKDCEHSFILKDDLGYVCRICGVIDRKIETIFEFQYNKRRSTRTYIRPQSYTDIDSSGINAVDSSGNGVMPNEIYAHPRHSKMMRLHQKEGFNFLASNLLGENPGGCILAHAPGSGKTFTLICFVQSFLAKHPNARPLVVLPKGIVSTWKKEFQTRQIEDLPLYDTAKRENRPQQFEVLKQWVDNRSILFLSYQQFSSIVWDLDSNEASTTCREILLEVPSILVLDEGHTPRNDNTDVFQALAKVKTPRKVVLSGTLYQNHVKEVFNVLNLVRPNFLKTETSRAIVTRIKSKVDLSLSGKHFKASSEAAFFEMVEDTLQKDKNFRRKVSVIHDLREMTSKVLHYYKGDFLDLPGLVDFTVLLNLSSKQKHVVEKVKLLPTNFKASSVGSAVYLHPKLQSFSDGTVTDDKMDELLENLNVDDGVKTKFFLNVLSLCEAKKEKLLVFSQYLAPMKFLERLAAKEKGWSLGKEIFVISGKSSAEVRECSMERFNSSPAAKVFFGSIKACGEGISLVGASRIIIMDVHLNPSVTRQAIGRAFRPGQTKKVVVYRLVAAASREVEDYETCTKKELISKMWFEWKEYCGNNDFEVGTVEVSSCGDDFLEGNPILEKDIKLLYRR